MFAAADNAPLGRLFLTPAERASLDVVRQNSKPPEKIVKAGDGVDDEEKASAASAPPAALPIVTVHGYVKRSDGKGTVWINGKPVQEKDSTKEVEVGRMRGDTNQVQIKLPSTGQTVNLKAGQSYDPASGRVGSLREISPAAQTAPVEPAAKPAAKPAAEPHKAAPALEESPAAAVAPASTPPK
jgi:hypothetical protein